jgi:glutamine amidotransferase
MVSSPAFAPSRDQLLIACANNPDGFGWAVNIGSKIISGKSFNAEHSVKTFLDLLKKYSNAWGMFHARIATHGAVCIDNTHPYKVGGRSDLILAHNGVLSIEVPKGDNRSDSRVFAEDWLPELGVGILDDEQGFIELENLCGGSKLAILSTAPELKKPVYIINEDLGHWVEGLWWSNHSYKTGSSYWGGSYWIDSDDDEDYSIGSINLSDEVEGDCSICGGFAWEPEQAICDTCDHCLECAEFYTACLCYVPRRWWSLDNSLRGDDERVF